MKTNVKEQNELITDENCNKATKVIFERMFKISKLKDGETIEGRIKHSDLKLDLYSEFFGHIPTENQDWGEIAIHDIYNFQKIELFYEHIKDHLVDLSLVFWSPYVDKRYLCFTKTGFIEYSLLKAQGKDPNYFFEKVKSAPLVEKVVMEKVETELKIIEGDELEKIILQKVYEFESMYDLSIRFDELAFRVINLFNPTIERFNSIYDIESSNEYSNFAKVKELLNNTVLKLFRRDLLLYDVRLSTKITLTNRGRIFYQKVKL